MNKLPTTVSACLMAFAMALSAGPAHADSLRQNDRDHREARAREPGAARPEAPPAERRDTLRSEREMRDERHDARPAGPPAVREDRREDRRDDWRADRRDDQREAWRDERRGDWRPARVAHRHYPSHGTVIQVLPPAHRIVTYRGSRYMFWEGVWYRPSGSRFVVIAPPIGIVVPVLPIGYLSLWIGGTRYYYANDVYYLPDPHGYVVVERPAGAPAYPEDDAADTAHPLFVYPRQGQSEAQQADDRYECHRWARDQTGFDPSRAEPDAAAHADYDRAMTACLEGRGYTVR